MGFNLLWTDEDVESVSENFSYRIARDLENALEDKDRQVTWIKNMSDLRNRFQKMFNLEDLTVAEIRFSSMSAEYRALCVVLSDEDLIVYYDLVPKKGSYQQRALSQMRENSSEIEEAIRKNIS